MTPPFGSRIETLVDWKPVSLLMEARPVRAGSVRTAAPSPPSEPAAASTVGCPVPEEPEQPAICATNAAARVVTPPNRYDHFRIMDGRPTEIERPQDRRPRPRHSRAPRTVCVLEAARC